MRYSIRTFFLAVAILAVSFTVYSHTRAVNRFELQTADNLRDRFPGGVLMFEESDSWFPKQRVESICLGAKGLTDEDLRRICQLREIRALRIGRSDVTDEGLKSLENLHKLEVLSLTSAPISDAGVESLARLPQLRTLILQKTQITDASIPQLSKLVRLERLNVRKTMLSPDGLKQLQAALPACKIDSDQQR